MHAQSRVSASNRPQTSSGGAAGTYIAALSRIGWSSPAYNAIRTRDGTILQLDQQAPKTILRFLQDDFDIVFAAATTVFTPQQGGLGNLAGGYAERKAEESEIRYCLVRGQPIPWFQPAASVINSKWAKRISPSAIASVATLPEGGWWTQARLAACGLAEHPFCTLCHNAVGTLAHRLFRLQAQGADSKPMPEIFARICEDGPGQPAIPHRRPRTTTVPGPATTQGKLDWQSSRRWSGGFWSGIHRRCSTRHGAQSQASRMGLHRG